MTYRSGLWLFLPWLLFLISATGVVVLFVERVFSSLPVAFVGEQIDIFEEMRQRTQRQMDATEVAGGLAYVVNYYPSGTKQRAGSTLDRIVEGYRAAVTREMIGRLRTLTGDELGDNPQPWIEKYDKK